MAAETPEGDLAVKVLDEYMQDFQRRNPTLRVFCCYLHQDEATPHLHIDFVALYWYLSLKPIIAVIPCMAGVVMFTALFWVFADYIGNTPVRIILKIIILGIAVMIELCIWINATLPWLEKKTAPKPRIRKVED